MSGQLFMNVFITSYSADSKHSTHCFQLKILLDLFTIIILIIVNKVIDIFYFVVAYMESAFLSFHFPILT